MTLNMQIYKNGLGDTVVGLPSTTYTPASIASGLTQLVGVGGSALWVTDAPLFILGGLVLLVVVMR